MSIEQGCMSSFHTDITVDTMRTVTKFNLVEISRYFSYCDEHSSLCSIFIDFYSIPLESI